MNPAIDLELQERRLRQAMLDGDVEVLAQLLCDGLIFTNQDGVRLTKESDLATHRSRTLTIEALNTVGEPTVRLLGDTAIVFTVAELAGKYAGKTVGGLFAYTRVWHRGTGQWRVEAGHCSQIPAGRDDGTK
jgi:ketosteroid isomerase-like protein